MEFLKDLEFLGAIVMEALRIYAVALNTSSFNVQEDIQIGKYTFKKGEGIYMNI
jgi:cytochrome P450